MSDNRLYRCTVRSRTQSDLSRTTFIGRKNAKLPSCLGPPQPVVRP
jgi:hypothetical protein